MRIKKIENAIGLVGNVLNKLSKSNKDTYSANYLNERLVRVSQTEPETGEEVWIKPNKNLFNINATPNKTYYSIPTVNGDTLQTSGASGNFIAYVIDVEPNTKYTVSVRSKTSGISVYDKSIDNYIAGMGDASNNLTFNSGNNTQIAVVFYGGGTFEKPQLEQGEVVTSYDSYMNRKIYTKNSNGKYIELYNDDFKGTNTDWIELNNVIRYRKVNNVVYVMGNSQGTVVVGNGEYKTVGTLPVGFRIPYGFYFTWSGVSGDIKNQSARIQHNGNIDLYLPSGQSLDTWGFIVSFPVD